MPVKSYVEFGQKFTQLVVAFLSDKSIVVSTVYGTEVARTKIEENPIEFTTSVSGEERFFGVLTDTGQIYVFQFQLIDTQPRYLRYLKDLRSKTMSGNETDEEFQRRQIEDLNEAQMFFGIKLIYEEIETFDLHALLPAQNHTKIIKLVITQQKNAKFFVIADDQGYISVVGKGQRTHKSTFVGNSRILDMQ